VVIDESFMHSMIPETRRPLFKEERIFLKGVADTTPRRIFYLDAKVRIGSEFLRPTAPQHFHTDNYEATGADVMSLAPVFRHAMKHVPVEGFDAEILALIPKYNEGKLVAGVALHHEQKARYVMSGGSYYTELDMAQIQQVIKRANVPGDAKVKIKVTYPVAQPVRSVDEVRAAPNEPTFIESWKELVARTR
jgi:hypothetical protein